ncbi:ABC transporter ATP-binding protein [Haematobacter missouriensis]|uniref:Nickel import system ATP-binding protein NikD n=1 Tax=Haematobacter missouriensis TaxID=366616 RepID=A0A212AJ07_9RHOB|nr:ABC transporter ATP-binding protein [Haematobacter missouriensis]OWJ74124.1 ABC transporter ATP-binding protein [Haematobacter missouriensis]OWJ81491.1 ABC transporter ATP-binding protein [Haematobacter missouriensis]
MSVLASLRGLSVAYGGTPVLHGVDLDLRAGERLALIGESGSGKSTLALALAGLLPVSARMTGQIDWASGPVRPGRDYGFVFQQPAASFDPVLSIGNQMTEVLRHHLKLAPEAVCGRAAELLARVGIPEPSAALRRFPHQFSGGQLQRIAIATAIAAEPNVLIADEATSALDTMVQARIVALLRTLTAPDSGMTLLFITHDIALASGLADRIAVMEAGRIIQVGSAVEVLAAPLPYTARLLAAHLDLDSPRLVSRYP